MNALGALLFAIEPGFYLNETCYSPVTKREDKRERTLAGITRSENVAQSICTLHLPRAVLRIVRSLRADRNRARSVHSGFREFNRQRQPGDWWITGGDPALVD